MASVQPSLFTVCGDDYERSHKGMVYLQRKDHSITHKWSDKLNVFLFVMLYVRAIQSYCYIFFNLIWSQTSGFGIELFLCTDVEAALRMCLCTVTQNNSSLAFKGTLNTLKNTHKKRRTVVWKLFFPFFFLYLFRP